MAVDNYSMAIQRDGELWELYLLRGTSYLALGKSRASITDLDRFIMMQPQHAVGHETRGVVYFGIDDWESCKRDMTKALDLNSALPVAYLLRGKA